MGDVMIVPTRANIERSRSGSVASNKQLRKKERERRLTGESLRIGGNGLAVISRRSRPYSYLLGRKT